MDPTSDIDQRQREIQREYLDFLDDGRPPPCANCGNAVTWRHHGIICDGCKLWFHRKTKKCDSGMTQAEYKAYNELNTTFQWKCLDCAAAPGSDLTLTDNLTDYPPPDITVHDERTRHNSTTIDGHLALSLQVDVSPVRASVSSIQPDVSMLEVSQPVPVPAINAIPDPSFNVEMSIQPRAPVQDAPLPDRPPAAVIVPDGPVTYEVLKGASRKGSDMLLSSDGYTFVVKRRNDTTGFVSWECSVRVNRKGVSSHCSAKVKQYGVDYVASGVTHNHPADPTKSGKLKCSVMVKTKATEQVSTKSGTIVKSAMRELEALGVPVSQKPRNLAKAVNRHRHGERPTEPLPTDMMFKDDQGIYLQKVRDMIANNEVRLIVNINDLRRKNPGRANGLLNEAFQELIALQRALKEFVASADPIYSKQHEEFFVGFVGSFGGKHVSPRTLTSRFLGNLVCVEGIVTKCSLIRPKVVRSVHYCPTTKKTMERRYTDMTSLEAFPSSSAYPTKDEDGNLLETEYGLSVYKDHQTFSIQEMPEKAPAGQLPRSVDIIADNDLVDTCKPGDRIQCIGTFRCLPGKKNGYTSGTFRTILLASNIQLMSKEVSPTFSAEDVAKIKKFSRQKSVNVFDVLGKSLAPSIHGHEYIKKAVLCMLLGGTEKVLANGSRLRGDINVLLIGDPSVAKSQMLRYVLHTAPRAVTTTGRGSSGVGLTAAVTTDQETGERRLEAGAMVLADRGVVCIDEFDKMSDMDRTAIHEVMEQGRVTVAKAGIHAKLNARCSVLAAANPVYGRYDQFKTPMENIGLQDSLLSRFDLIFIVLDKMDPELDRNISDHVLRMHRYRNATEQDGDVLPFGTDVDMLATTDPDFEETEDSETPIYEKHDKLLHGPAKSKQQKIVSMQFMRKYIHVAKALKPNLTQPAAELLAEEYSKLRSHDSMTQDNVARTAPVTARTLETMIRLSTAHAKARLSKTVDLEDAEAAVELIEFAYFKKVEKKKRKRHRSDGEDEGESSQDEQETDSQTDKPAKKKQRSAGEKRPARKEGDDGYDPYDFEEDEASADESQPERPRRKPRSRSQDEEAMDTGKQGDTQIDNKKLKTFRAKLFDLFKSEHAQSVHLDKVKAQMGSDFSEDEVFGAIEKMMDANQVMLADDVVFLI